MLTLWMLFLMDLEMLKGTQHFTNFVLINCFGDRIPKTEFGTITFTSFWHIDPQQDKRPHAWWPQSSL